MDLLNRSCHVLAFDDSQASNNPQRRYFDWRRSVQSISVEDPRALPLKIEPFQEVTVFDGTRTLLADGTTQYALTLSSLDPSRYRLAWTGTGTAPAFRTARALSLTGGSVTTVVNSNATLTVTHSAGAVFGTVQVGDVVFIPGTLTGDAALFDPLNEGEWSVLSASATTLVLVRLPGVVFSGLAETKAITTADQFQAYSATGVQVGDTLDLTAGFAATALHSYKIVAVTAKRVEFVSTIALAAQTLIPGATAVKVFAAAKRYLLVEADQEVALKLNGGTDETNRIEPLLPADKEKTGWHEKWGLVYQLVIKNRSAVRVNVNVLVAE